MKKYVRIHFRIFPRLNQGTFFYPQYCKLFFIPVVQFVLRAVQCDLLGPRWIQPTSQGQAPRWQRFGEIWASLQVRALSDGFPEQGFLDHTQRGWWAQVGRLETRRCVRVRRSKDHRLRTNWRWDIGEPHAFLEIFSRVAPDTELAGYPVSFFLPDIRYPAGYQAE